MESRNRSCSTRLPLACLLLAGTTGWACGAGGDGRPVRADGGPGETGAAAGAPGQGECILVEEGFGPEGSVEVRAEEVVSGLEVPWGIAFLPDGDLLVTERPGRLRLVELGVDGGRLVPEPVASLEAEAVGEGGLLGIALHPEFESNRAFFLYVTVGARGAPTNRLERWRLAPDGRSATRERVVLDDVPAATFHNGGRLRIGPDGMLWVGTGDAGDPERAQERRSLAGKLLRLTPDGEVPPDNPFPGSPVYLLGIRNTQGFDWPDALPEMGTQTGSDPGTVWLTDHGPSGELGRSGHDEVSVAAAGENLGWPPIWGCRSEPEMVTPALTWERAVPPGGAAVYTGEAIPEWQGDLLVGSLGARHLHRVVFSDSEAPRVERHEVYFGGRDGLGRLREVVMGPDGDLWVTTSNCDGRGRCPPEGDRILRITGPSGG